MTQKNTVIFGTDSTGEPENIKSINGATSVTDAIPPSTQATPEISGTPTAEVSIETTAAEIFGARFTYNPISDAAASARLSAMHPDVKLLNSGESIVLYEADGFDTIYIEGVGSADDLATHVVAHDNTTDANHATAMIKFDFTNETTPPKYVEITLSKTWNSNAEALIRCEGYIPS